MRLFFFILSLFLSVEGLIKSKVVSIFLRSRFFLRALLVEITYCLYCCDMIIKLQPLCKMYTQA